LGMEGGSWGELLVLFVALAVALGAWLWWSQKRIRVEGLAVMPGLSLPVLGHLMRILSWPADNHMAIHEQYFKALDTSTYLITAPGFPASRMVLLTIDPGERECGRGGGF
jgi:hypothetical protein